MLTGRAKALIPAYSPPADANAPILVTVFLRGGADGLNVVVPYGDPDYKRLRSTIRIVEPGKNDGALDLDGYFGFHPRLSAFKEFYDQGILGVIHACGSHNETRSHFDAMDFMESGSSTEKLHDGWLNRYLGLISSSGDVFRATSFGPTLPYSLRGKTEAISLASLEALQVNQSPQMNTYLNALEELYAERGDLLGEIAVKSLEAIEMGRSELNPGSYQPENGAEYSDSDFGRNLRSLAQIIKANIGLEISSIDLGGWDTHANQGDGARGELANALSILNDGLQAFILDIHSYLPRIIILVMSEFGRTARQNGSGGTDHGHGTVMFALGGNVHGGRVLGSWPGLSDRDLYQARDLAVTTDFRRLFAEVLEFHMGCEKIGTVFPGYDYSTDPLVGLFG